MQPSSTRKVTGRVYTPPALAAFLARRAIAATRHPRGGVALDPACGDGALLSALVGHRPEWKVHGIDVDATALSAARRRLPASATLIDADFLEGSDGAPPADLVIANPPYVRTQLLGAARAAQLRERFGLVGRVDLLHAFIVASFERLAPGGVLALLASNRFLTTRAGAGVRDVIGRRAELVELIDLGDTGLFDAAVLPAILIARLGTARTGTAARGVRVYRRGHSATCSGGPAERSDPPAERSDAPATRSGGVDHAAVLDEIDEGTTREVDVGGLGLIIDRGIVKTDAASGTWRISTPAEERWTAAVRRRAPLTFGDVARIRVGVKTTADAVFVRPSFAALPAEERPEAAIVRPLLTRDVAAPFQATSAPTHEVLYPHEIVDGARRAIDLDAFPRAARYLERHRERLSSRTYVMESGRRWYELWVPHRPDGWAEEKVVFPDIAERPCFFLDRTGAVVAGHCYWLVAKSGGADVLKMILAIANSSLALRWYDAECGNRLYHGRRRFITQYVERFPIPDPDGAAGRRLVAAVDERMSGEKTPAADAAVEEVVRQTLERGRS